MGNKESYYLTLATVVKSAMSEYTFSGGTFIPKGTNPAVVGRAINQDEVFVLDFSDFFSTSLTL